MKKLAVCLALFVALTSCTKRYHQFILTTQSPELVTTVMNDYLVKPQTSVILQRSPNQYWILFRGNLKKSPWEGLDAAGVGLLKPAASDSARAVTRSLTKDGKWKQLKLDSPYDMMLAYELLLTLDELKNHKKLKLTTVLNEDNNASQSINVYYTK